MMAMIKDLLCIIAKLDKISDNKEILHTNVLRLKYLSCIKSSRQRGWLVGEMDCGHVLQLQKKSFKQIDSENKCFLVHIVYQALGQQF